MMGIYWIEWVRVRLCWVLDGATLSRCGDKMDNGRGNLLWRMQSESYRRSDLMNALEAPRRLRGSLPNEAVILR